MESAYNFTYRFLKDSKNFILENIRKNTTRRDITTNGVEDSFIESIRKSTAGLQRTTIKTLLISCARTSFEIY